MTVTPLTPERVAKLLVVEGFTGWQVVTMGAIGRAESGLDPHAYNLNDHDTQSVSYRSFDWGIWEINDYWWEAALRAAGILRPDLPASMQLLRPRVNASAVRFVFDVALYVAGGDVTEAYRQWNVYKVGAHEQYLHDARLAARAVGVDV